MPQIVFNEQTPVDGGMEVNALRIGAKIPTLADVNLVLGHSQASLADCTAAAPVHVQPCGHEPVASNSKSKLGSCGHEQQILCE